MARRHQFRSSSPVAPPRPASTARRTARGVLVTAGAALLAVLFFRPSPPDDLKRRFAAHRADFNALRDMITAEPSLTAVGVDNVGEFWLFDGKWTAAGQRFVAYNRSEMLTAAGLSPERYDDYLARLGRVGAYRVARQSAAGVPARGAVFLLPEPHRGPAAHIVFSRRPPTPLLTWDAARRANHLAYAPLEDGWYAEFP